jgi:hypothetical protein
MPLNSWLRRSFEAGSYPERLPHLHLSLRDARPLAPDLGLSKQHPTWQLGAPGGINSAGCGERGAMPECTDTPDVASWRWYQKAGPLLQ